jgi:hypothetical protein
VTEGPRKPGGPSTMDSRVGPPELDPCMLKDEPPVDHAMSMLFSSALRR